jgi:hypothetical protein
MKSWNYRCSPVLTHAHPCPPPGSKGGVAHPPNWGAHFSNLGALHINRFNCCRSVFFFLPPRSKAPDIATESPRITLHPAILRPCSTPIGNFAMPRQRRGAAAPARSAPSRPTTAPARPNVTPQPPNRASSSAAYPPATANQPLPPAQVQAQPRTPGLFGQVSTATIICE